MENLGGFFATLKLLPDQSSFREAGRGLREIGDGIHKMDTSMGAFFTKTLDGFLKIGAAAVGAGIAMTAGSMKVIAQHQNDLASAFKAGLTVDQYTTWNMVMERLGYTAESTFEALAKIKQTLSSPWLKSDEFKKLATDLALSGTEMEKFAKLSSDERLKYLGDLYVKAKNKDAAYNLIQGIAGNDFANAVVSAYTRDNASVRSLYSRAADMRILDAKEIKDMSRQNLVTAELGTAFGQTSEMAGSAFLGPLEGVLGEIRDWLVQNKSSIQAFFSNMGKIAEALARLVGPLVAFAGKFIADTAETVAEISQGKFLTKFSESDVATASKLVRKSMADTGRFNTTGGGILGETLHPQLFESLHKLALYEKEWDATISKDKVSEFEKGLGEREKIVINNLNLDARSVAETGAELMANRKKTAQQAFYEAVIAESMKAAQLLGTK